MWPSASNNGSSITQSNESEVDTPSIHQCTPFAKSRATSYSPTPESLAIDDLRLLHHWTTKVTFFHCSPTESTAPAWSLDAIEVAFDHPFLLHGILAFAALHKTIDNPNADRPILLAQADAHVSSSLLVYRELLEHPTLAKALPMFFLSGILFSYNLATAQIEEPKDPLGEFLLCLRLLRGVREVVGRYWQQLSEMSIVHEMLSGVTDIERIPVPEDEERTYEPLSVLKELAASHKPPDRDVLVETVENLRRTFLRATACEDEIHEHSIFMTW
jgi:hypothetical protein